MRKPILLDLFCCAGGATRGYQLAGFYVVGVDISPQPHYIGDEFICTDAMSFPLDGFDVIHASPPCQDYTAGAHISRARKVHKDYPRLLAPMRERLRSSGALYVMENVAGAALTDKEMDNPLRLCGTSLGLHVERHRFFESNLLLFAAGSCHHEAGNVSVRKSRFEYIGISSGVTYTDAKGQIRKRPKSCPGAVARAAMGIDWKLTNAELGEAVPPLYTYWIGCQLMTALRHEGVA